MRTLNKRLAIIALIGLCTRSATATTNILFVGNSYTYGACGADGYNSGAITDANGTGMGGVPGVFKKMTTQAGLTSYNVTIEAVGGMSLSWHYANKAAIIGQTNWDLVVLQDQSTNPLPTSHGGNPSDFNAGVSNLVHLVISTNAAAKVFLYETFPRPDYCYPTNSTSYYTSSIPVLAMVNDLHAGYFGALSNYNCAGVGRVGDAFWQAISEGYADANPYDGIDAGKFNIWCSDNHHATAQGYYLAAAVFYGTITKVDPRTLSVSAGSAAAGLGLSSVDASNMNWIAYEITGATNSPPPAPVLPTANVLINTNNNFNWNTASNWSLGHSPNNDPLLINSSSPTNSQIANTFDGVSPHGASAQTLTIDTTNGTITIAANLTLSVARTLVLTGGTNALGGTDLIDLSPATTGTVLIATGTLGTLQIPLASDASINVENAQASLTLGAISFITGNFNLTKNGAGTLILAGTNTFGAGKTFTINAGTVLANTAVSGGNSATGNGGVSVSAAGTLGGAGQITPGAASQVVVASGGTVAPGSSSIGTLTLNGANTTSNVLAMAAGAKFQFKLNNSFQSDRIALVNGATGDIVFGGNIVNFTDLSSGALATGTYTLVTATAADNYAGLATDGSGNITNGLTIGTGLANYTASLQLVSSSIVLNLAPLGPPQPPSTPTNVTATAVSTNQISVTWSPSAGATSYIVASGGIPIATVSTPPYVNSGLTANTTYCYTIAATNSAGGSAFSSSSCAMTFAVPLPPFVLDGSVSNYPGYFLTSSGMTLYAAIRGTILYVATWSPGNYPTSSTNNDHFVLVSDQVLGSATTAAPWAKTGAIAIPSTKVMLCGESQGTYVGWQYITGASVTVSNQSIKAATNDGQMQGSIDLVQAFGSMPSTLYLCAAAYTTTYAGPLVAQTPAGNGNGNIESNEFLAIPVASIRDSTGDGLLDNLDPNLGFLVQNTQSSGSGFTITWAAVPGRSYQVMYCDSFPAGWTNLPNAQVTAGSGQTLLSFTDTSATNTVQRFYHINSSY
jgi:autotransporter-associated beta strand protein